MQFNKADLGASFNLGRRLTTGLVLAGALVAGGCSSGLEAASEGRVVEVGTPKRVEQNTTFANASTVASQYPAIEMSMTQSIGDQEIITMDGRFNNGSEPADVTGEATMHMSMGGLIETDMEMRIIAGVGYTKMDGFGDGKWVKAEAGAAQAGTSTPQTPTAVLDQLREAGDVVQVASSEIDGVAVDNYEFTIDMAAMAGQNAAGVPADMLDGLDASGTVSIDKDGFPRLMALTVDMSDIMESAGAPADDADVAAMFGDGVMKMNFAMTPLDAPVVVEAPDPSEVTEDILGG